MPGPESLLAGSDSSPRRVAFERRESVSTGTLVLNWPEVPGIPLTTGREAEFAPREGDGTVGAVTGTQARGGLRVSGLAVWGPLIALWLIWGSTYLGIAVLVESMPPMVGNGFRFLAAALVLGSIVALTRGPASLRVSRAELRSVSIMGVALLGVGIGTLSLAERYVPSGVAALLIAVMPLYVVLLRLRSGDRPNGLTLIGVAVGLAGLALMLLPGGTDSRRRQRRRRRDLVRGDHVLDVLLGVLLLAVRSVHLPAQLAGDDDLRDGGRGRGAGPRRNPARRAHRPRPDHRPSRGGHGPTSSPRPSPGTAPSPGCSATPRCPSPPPTRT